MSQSIGGCCQGPTSIFWATSYLVRAISSVADNTHLDFFHLCLQVSLYQSHIHKKLTSERPWRSIRRIRGCTRYNAYLDLEEIPPGCLCHSEDGDDPGCLEFVYVLDIDPLP
jgi:hypothetical protein